MADSPRQDPASSVSVRGLPDRGRVLCHGYIESVTYPPASNIAAFTAVVVDHDAPVKKRGATAAAGTPGAAPAAPGARHPRSAVPKDRLRVVWLGRRRIPGVDAGTELRLQGMVTVRDGLPTMFNPRYEILSRQEEQ
ncbi:MULTISPECIES: hypothetical protein [unclassified Arthrobacter]|uniref:hypothetical protein n=1 Tax=unclassified Arthrobacter TaxID=235627 RepID=UPI002DFF4D6A|nr:MULTISPECIES: hypothetical protein [unclassified Arthrobacter]MEC5192479.1 hypothetical protein [Arthrobacter sp. MP_M4]MEC5203963.1 hypothetical protein [Arthrobacter sp. MP_M7]